MCGPMKPSCTWKAMLTFTLFCVQLLHCHMGVLTASSVYSALIGRNVSLSCQLQGASRHVWDFCPTDQSCSHPTYLHDGHELNRDLMSSHSVRMINNDDGLQSIMLIENVTFSNAGRYSCSDYTNQEKKTTFQVHVLAHLPTCQLNVTSAGMSVEEYDVINVTCKVNSRGNLRHVCGCRYGQREEVKVMTESDGQFTRSELFVADRNLHGRNITCEFGFLSTTAFKYKWNSRPINVMYGPRSINARLVHDVLTCSTDSNPPPRYQWVDLSAGRAREPASFNGSEFNICSLDAVQESATNLEERVASYTFQCVASRGQHVTVTNLSFSLNLPADARKRCDVQPVIEHSSYLPTWMMVAIFCGVFVFCVVIIVTLIVSLVKHKRTASELRRLSHSIEQNSPRIDSSGSPEMLISGGGSAFPHVYQEIPDEVSSNTKHLYHGLERVGDHPIPTTRPAYDQLRQKSSLPRPQQPLPVNHTYVEVIDDGTMDNYYTLIT